MNEDIKKIPQQYLDFLGISFCEKCGDMNLSKESGILHTPLCFCGKSVLKIYPCEHQE